MMPVQVTRRHLTVASAAILAFPAVTTVHVPHFIIVALSPDYDKL